MTTQEILKGITSRNRKWARESANAIAEACQDRNRMLPLITYLPEIKRDRYDFGAQSPSKKNMEFAIRTLQFYSDLMRCPCALYAELDTFDPEQEVKKGNVQIIQRFYTSGVVTLYSIRCLQCKQRLHAEKQMNGTSWKWTKQEADPWSFDEYIDFPSPDKGDRVVYEDLGEVAMGGPLRGDGFLETRDKERYLLHDSCGGPPVWDLTGKRVALPIWTKDRGQHLGVVDMDKKELTTYKGRFGVLHLRAVYDNLVDLGSERFDLSKGQIHSVIPLAGAPPSTFASRMKALTEWVRQNGIKGS